jgi:hypothetical protein
VVKAAEPEKKKVTDGLEFSIDRADEVAIVANTKDSGEGLVDRGFVDTLLCKVVPCTPRYVTL